MWSLQWATEQRCWKQRWRNKRRGWAHLFHSVCLIHANVWESMGKPYSCTLFRKSCILYCKSGMNLYQVLQVTCCIWVCIEIKGLCDKTIVGSCTGICITCFCIVLHTCNNTDGNKLMVLNIPHRAIPENITSVVCIVMSPMATNEWFLVYLGIMMIMILSYKPLISLHAQTQCTWLALLDTNSHVTCSTDTDFVWLAVKNTTFL